MQFDHVALVVDVLSRGRSALEMGYGVNRWTEEYSDEINEVWVQFGSDAEGLCYELIAPLSSNSPVLRSQRRAMNITNHVAFRVPSLADKCVQLVSKGFYPVSHPKPAIAFGGARIQFFVSPINSLIELIEAPCHKHIYRNLSIHGVQ